MIHKSLSDGKWFNLSLVEQLANVGSDIERTIQWKKKGNIEYSDAAFERALELLNLTIQDPKNTKSRRKELTRVREALIDYFVFNNDYASSDALWRTYFFAFNYAAAIKRGV